MALGAASRVAAESANGERLFVDRISFAGDGAYVTGGTPDFDGTIKALLGDDRNVIAVIPGDCGNYLPLYVPAVGATPGKLLARLISTGAEAANAADLSAITFNVIVISK